jgi:pimeloyl-ACP methyl ester carboxylesterase
MDRVTGTSQGRSPRPGRPVEVAVVAAGVAGCWLAVRAGSPPWQVVRVLVVVAATAGLLLGLRRAGGAARAALSLCAGAVVVAVGAGVSAQWVVEGVSPTAVAGVVALVAGLVLSGAGVVGVVRAVPGRTRWIAGAAAAVAVLLVIAVVAVPVAATNVPPGPRPPARAELAGRAAEEVRFTTDDGIELAAWWVAPRGDAVAVVVPGSGSTRAAARDHAAELVGAGYGVLVLDHRGHGASDGTAMDLGWYGDLDLGAAVDEAVRRGAVPGRVAVVGLSMGGEEAVGLLAVDRRIGAVVAEGVTGRAAADKAWLSEEYGVRGSAQEALDRVTFWVTDLLPGASPPTPLSDAVEAGRAPLLLLAAGEVPDEGLVAERLRAVAPGRVDVWEVDGAGHTDALAVDPAGWRARVLGFLDRAVPAG